LSAAVRLPLVATPESSPGRPWLPRASHQSSLRKGSIHASSPEPHARQTYIRTCSLPARPRRTSLPRHAHAASERLLPASPVGTSPGRACLASLHWHAHVATGRLLPVGPVGLVRETWAMTIRLSQATNEYALPAAREEPLPRLPTSVRPRHLRPSPTGKPKWYIPRAGPLQHILTSAMSTPPPTVSYRRT